MTDEQTFDLGVEPVEDTDKVKPTVAAAVWHGNKDLSAAVDAFTSAAVMPHQFGIKTLSLPPSMDFLMDRTTPMRLVTWKE